jgi:hypothetical protein
MFQTNRSKLQSTIAVNIVAAVTIIILPTVVLLGLIASRNVGVSGGAVVVDVSLGILLVFSSLAAVVAPLISRIFVGFKVNGRAGLCVVCYVSCKKVDYCVC